MLTCIKKLFNKTHNIYPFTVVDGKCALQFKYHAHKIVDGVKLPIDISVTHVSSKISNFQLGNLISYRVYSDNMNSFLQLNYDSNNVFLDAIYCVIKDTMRASNSISKNDYEHTMSLYSVELFDKTYLRDIECENTNPIELYDLIETFQSGSIKHSKSMIYRSAECDGIIDNDLLYIESCNVNDIDKCTFYDMYLIEYIDM